MINLTTAPDLLVGWEGCSPPHSTPLLMLSVSRVAFGASSFVPTFQTKLPPLSVVHGCEGILG